MPAALGDVRGRLVLLPRTDIAREETPGALRAAGALVDDIVFYRTVPAPLDPAARAELDAGIDILTFTSPSTVEAFRAALGPAAEILAARATIACIGPVTAEAVREAGWPVHVLPAEYTTAALVAALARVVA
jgi:uroporphyrinogen-III synthase